MRDFPNRIKFYFICWIFSYIFTFLTFRSVKWNRENCDTQLKRRHKLIYDVISEQWKSSKVSSGGDAQHFLDFRIRWRSTTKSNLPFDDDACVCVRLCDFDIINEADQFISHSQTLKLVAEAPVSSFHIVGHFLISFKVCRDKMILVERETLRYFLHPMFRSTNTNKLQSGNCVVKVWRITWIQFEIGIAFFVSNRRLTSPLLLLSVDHQLRLSPFTLVIPTEITEIQLQLSWFIVRVELRSYSFE